MRWYQAKTTIEPITDWISVNVRKDYALRFRMQTVFKLSKPDISSLPEFLVFGIFGNLLPLLDLIQIYLATLALFLKNKAEPFLFKWRLLRFEKPPSMFELTTFRLTVTAWKVPLFWVFLVLVFPHLD